MQDKAVEINWRPLGFEEIHPPLGPAQALFESERCLECGGPGEPAPCITACPTHIDIPRFIREIKDGKPEEAARTIFASNALGGTCARVCPVEELCEGACVMKKEGRRAVEIGRLQRFATDSVLPKYSSSSVSVTEHEHAPDAKRIAILGAGPAGLACAEELACLGYQAIVYEKKKLPGGLVTYGIAPYKQKVDPMIRECNRIAELGVDFQFGVQVGVDLSFEDLHANHDAIFIGVGMGADSSAGIPGEDLPGVWESLRFIEAIKCGEHVDLGRRVAVIGGGNTALDVVREAVRLGVEEVRLVYRRDEASMPAFRHEVEAAKHEGVQFEFLCAPTEILGRARVEGLECKRMELGEPDASGRRRPIPVPGSEFVLQVDSVITAIGQKPLMGLFEALQIEVQDGRVVVGERFQTSEPTIFAGGDCITGGTTVVESVRHGKLAARGIHQALAGETFKLPEPELAAETKTVQDGPFAKRSQGGYYLATSTTLCKGCNLCVNSCPVDILFLDSKSKIQATDISKCVFCGMCEMRCPDFAIWVVKDAEKPHPIEIEARRRLAL